MKLQTKESSPKAVHLCCVKISDSSPEALWVELCFLQSGTSCPESSGRTGIHSTKRFPRNHDAVCLATAILYKYILYII